MPTGQCLLDCVLFDSTAEFFVIAQPLLCYPLALVLALAAVRADVVPAPLFTDGAVLQQEQPVAVWGQADVGERVAVSFAGQRISATAGADGRWMVLLEPLAASAAMTDLTIEGRNRIVVRDILVGEVWLCAGEGGMELPLGRTANGAAEVAAADYPLIRHVKIRPTLAPAPMHTVVTTGWRSASPTEAGTFTAVGYFFARELHRRQDVPVGVVNVTLGSTPIEAWLSAFALAGLAGRAQPAVKSHASDDRSMPAAIFNGMIYPLLPFSLRGALWHQGESDAGRVAAYHPALMALISSWRVHFGQVGLPFYWVNLAAFKFPADSTGMALAYLREAQSRTLVVPDTGQALAIDLGGRQDPLPEISQEVGRRLGLLARRRVYGRVLDDAGPTLASVIREGGALRLRFRNAGSGLVAHNHPVQSLAVAAADRVFHPATGRIERDTLVVSSPLVREPVAVRYAWENAPSANLFSGSGLPAVPFRSDNW